MITPEESYESFIEEHTPGQELAVYPESRTELEVEEELSMLAVLSGSFWPIHLQEWDKLPDSLPKEELLSIFMGSPAIRPIDTYYNRDLLIHGAIIRYYPPFNSMPDDDGRSNRKAGYYRALFWTDLKDEFDNPIILAMSAQGIGTHLSILLKKNGWYLWRNLETGEPTPKVYRFSRPGGKSIQMFNVKNAEERAFSSR